MIKDNKDGSATCMFEYGEDFGKLYLKRTGKKKITERGIGNWLKKLLMEYLKNESK